MTNNKKLPFAKAICYSGYRDGQSPETDELPTYDQVKQDLLILKDEWQSLRLYASDEHSKTVLDVISKEKMSFDVMLGAYIIAEMSNPECPWGADYSEEQLQENRQHNQQEITKLIALANTYKDIVSSVSIGNEASVSWTDHLVPTESLVDYAKQIKSSVSQPVTFCENYVPWLDKLKPLVDEIDFISIHTYPVWEYKSIQEGLAYTIENYNAVAQAYPDVQIVITEAGWATNSNGLGIDTDKVNEVYQKQYYQQLMDWAEQEQVLVYFFEAFDESWKGSCDPLEPEKHWGLYRTDRSPKLVMNQNAQR
ncbi:MAG TPA: glycosyl hydrolase [Cellvibrionales bacterium]|jgi:exo-beta-1,3-glucanase (GH17 family)|nr:glycosyl hydrolase [Cellvibrionales bacterium]HAW13842.1 glycosyl hydrolase [Cellvibrionales bacterium]HCX26855.1 glycosyl hydrolase [Cellvibrionales bacterium]